MQGYGFRPQACVGPTVARPNSQEDKHFIVVPCPGILIRCVVFTSTDRPIEVLLIGLVSFLYRVVMVNIFKIDFLHSSWHFHDFGFCYPLNPPGTTRVGWGNFFKVKYSPISIRIICVPNLVQVRRSCRKNGGGGYRQTDKGTLHLIVDYILAALWAWSSSVLTVLTEV